MSEEEIEICPIFPMENDYQMNVDNSDYENEVHPRGNNEGDDESTEEIMEDDNNHSSRSVAWTYFKRDKQNIKKAICNTCAQVLSLPTGNVILN